MYDATVLDRFEAKIYRCPETGCWLWTASLIGGGYGRISVRRRTVLAHRLAWEEANGRSIPDGLFVCHRCDVPRCVRPDHLFLGTQQDNHDDKWRKGRGASGDKNGRRKHPETAPRGDNNGARTHPHRLARGVVHHAARLTEADVVECRTRHAAGESVAALARAFGVAAQSMHKVVERRSWKHVA
jgi:hypothetical protein